MKSVSRKKKVTRRALIIFGILLIAIIGIPYYIIVHRFKESIQYAVSKESGGKYAFDADKATISFFNKTITLKKVSLHCIDTTNVNQYYDVKVPEIYFSFTSWKNLIFNKKLIVDSLAIAEPDISIHVLKEPEANLQQTAAFKTADILNFLEKTLVHFNAHSFSIKNLSFTYQKQNGPKPLRGSNISINIVNFTKVDNNDRHLFGSDTISLSLGRQNWILPDGIHEVSFKNFSFYSSSQKIELDSFTFRQKATQGRPAVVIEGDKFFFNSSRLGTIYQKDELNIDTLFCLNPVLTIMGTGSNDNNKKNNPKKDSAVLAQAGHALFKLIRIKFINVIDGEFHFKSNDLDTSASGAHKSNASIYNLVIDNENDKSLTTDSIKINLKDIQFYSSDSLSKLKIADFILQGKNAIFRNVQYLPSEFNHDKKGITFTAPALLLKNINLSELMKNRFKAQSAQLVHPSIIVYNKTKPGVPETRAATQNGDEKMSLFFRSLHRIKDLLDVEKFDIADGIANYKIAGVKPLQVSASKLNANFLLNKLFISDSLLDIKHSIPNFQIGDLNLTGKNMHVKVTNYRFDGTNRRNWGDRLLVSMANGTQLIGNDLYWEIFDWDVYQQTKDIQIDSLRIGNLAIRLKSNKEGTSKQNSPPKDLPVIRIARLDVKKMDFISSSLQNKVLFKASNFIAENLGTTSHFFTWTNAKINLSNILSKGNRNTATVKNVALNMPGETQINQINYEGKNEQGSTTLSVPLVTFQMNLQSSDFSKLSLQSLAADDANLTLFSGSSAQKKVAKPSKLPAILLDKLNMNHVSVHYSKATLKDTMTLQSVLNIKANGLQTFNNNEKVAAYKQIEISAHSINIDKENMHVSLPSSSLNLRNGNVRHNEQNKISLASAIDFATKGAALHYKRDSTSLAVKKFSLAFKDNDFQFSSSHKLSWKKLAQKTTLNGEDVLYKGKKITAAAESYSLDHAADKLNVINFSIIPNLNREESLAAAKWQNDYMIIKGKSLTVDHFIFNKTPFDSSLFVQKIIVDEIDLNTSRDKSIPFQHGIEKLMPTRLIEKIAMPVTIDSVLLINGKVTYNEFSAGTKKWSTLPLTHLNGNLTHITNQYKPGDSLKLSVSVDLFGNHIRHFLYKESYTDSLSGFFARYSMSPVDLTEFSKFSKPLAGVSITNGIADTVYASWKGNKYAAFGKMNFHYRDLKIKLYNKKDTSRQGFVPAVETFFANLILPSKKSKSSLIYFVRDREKFIFNYWIKSQVSGILSTFGIKKDKKYKQQYEKNSKKHSY